MCYVVLCAAKGPAGRELEVGANSSKQGRAVSTLGAGPWGQAATRAVSKRSRAVGNSPPNREQTRCQRH
jgi:hypothetical protein